MWTIDEHDIANPIKKFPSYEYLKLIVDEWITHRLLVIAKSRQMLMTWLFADLLLWDAMFFEGRLNFFQSKREEDAVYTNLRRAKFTYGRLPEFFKRAAPLSKPLGQERYNRLEFVHNSTLWAIPQGPEIIRSHTASRILTDEFAFQEQPEETLAAMKPTIDGGGSLAIVSTPNGPTFFKKIVFDLF